MHSASNHPATSATADGALAKAAVEGDASAFESIVRLYDADLRFFATRIVGPGAVDDVLQEAYLKAYRSVRSFRVGRGSLRGWLFRIVYSCAIDCIRASRRVPTPHSGRPRPDLPAAEPGPHEVVSGRDRIESALAALPVEERGAVILVDALGFDYAGAAAVLHIRTGTLGSRLHRARQAIRKVIEESQLEEERRSATI